MNQLNSRDNGLRRVPAKIYTYPGSPAWRVKEHRREQNNPRGLAPAGCFAVPEARLWRAIAPCALANQPRYSKWQKVGRIQQADSTNTNNTQSCPGSSAP